MERFHSALSLLPSYAVIAYGCAECPKLSCGREGCDTEFCYHCRQLWHPNQTCDQARRQRARHTSSGNDSSALYVFNEEPGGGLCLSWDRCNRMKRVFSGLLNKHPLPLSLQMQRRSNRALAAAPTSWRPMMAAATAWTAPCVPVSSAGSACRRSPTCTTSGIQARLLRRVFLLQSKANRLSCVSVPQDVPSGARSHGRKPARFYGRWACCSEHRWSSPS